MIRLSAEVGELKVESLEDTFAIILKGDELRGFVPDKLLEQLPTWPGTGTVIGVTTASESDI